MESALAPRQSTAATILIEIAAFVLLLLNMFFSMVVAMKDSTVASELVGAMFGPPIVALVVFGLARLFKKAATRRGRALLVLVTMLLVLFGNIGNLGSP